MNEIFVSYLLKNLEEAKDVMHQLKDIDANNWNTIESQLRSMLKLINEKRKTHACNKKNN